jgi:hypothetical protein
MEGRGASVIVLAFIVASGKLYGDTNGLNAGEKSIIDLMVLILKTLR